MVVRHRVLPTPLGHCCILVIVTNTYSCLIVLTQPYSCLLDLCIHYSIKTKVVSYVLKRLLPTSLGGYLH